MTFPSRSNGSTVADRLSEIVGDRHVLSRPSELLVYNSDGLPGYRKQPRLAVFPGTRDQAIAIVTLLAKEGLAFVPRGAGTGLSGGALADDIIVIGLHRLKEIISLDIENRRATVEPGVVNLRLNKHVAPHGLLYAPDPSSEAACTIGGNVAENAGGPHCLKYGVTLNHVLAMTVVLPSGEVVELGSRFGEHDGYDLRGAFIGSEGCFGLALDITVKLTQRPQTVRTLLADFMSVDEAARVTSAIIASGIVPAALEFMDGPTIRVVEESIYAAGYPKDAEAVLLIELDGLEAGVSADLEIVRRVCLDGGARNVKVARDEAERLKLWQGRKKAFGAMGRIASHLIVQDAVIPRTRLSEILEKIHGISEKYGVLVCNVFHAGDGNLHPNIAYSADDPGESERVHKAMTEIMNTCIAAGGSITGEHGVGLDKMGYMESIFSEPSLNAMCELRGVFDPNRRANPGKVVPIHSCKEWNAVASARGISEPVSSLSAEPARPSAR
ncbi:MAG TPA: FAD-linked oxidase C-terminal domain-containing protein [Gemmatimonadaceae bacterium]|jgi:glycolate oxidase subunit GlcD|nr:FAD-linked oxidase C-terminal domain-containing protein [Gemmatimonadaceae bacterium]